MNCVNVSWNSWCCCFFLFLKEKLVVVHFIFFPFIWCNSKSLTIFWGWQSHRMFISIHTLIWTEWWECERERTQWNTSISCVLCVFFVRCGNTTTYNQYIMNWRKFSIFFLFSSRCEFRNIMINSRADWETQQCKNSRKKCINA